MGSLHASLHIPNTSTAFRKVASSTSRLGRGQFGRGGEAAPSGAQCSLFLLLGVLRPKASWSTGACPCTGEHRRGWGLWRESGIMPSVLEGEKSNWQWDRNGVWWVQWLVNVGERSRRFSWTGPHHLPGPETGRCPVRARTGAALSRPHCAICHGPPLSLQSAALWCPELMLWAWRLATGPAAASRAGPGFCGRVWWQDDRANAALAAARIWRDLFSTRFTAPKTLKWWGTKCFLTLWKVFVLKK